MSFDIFIIAEILLSIYHICSSTAFIYPGTAFGWFLIHDKEKRPPALISVSPENGSSGVPIDTFITATFDKPIDSSTVIPHTFHVKSTAGIALVGSITVAPGKRTISFVPANVLDYLTTYLATVSGLIRAEHGSGHDVNHTWSFTTIAGKRPAGKRPAGQQPGQQ